MKGCAGCAGCGMFLIFRVYTAQLITNLNLNNHEEIFLGYCIEACHRCCFCSSGCFERPCHDCAEVYLT